MGLGRVSSCSQRRFLPATHTIHTHSLALSALRRAFFPSSSPNDDAQDEKEEQEEEEAYMDPEGNAEHAALLSQMRSVPLYRAALLGVGMAVA